MNGSGRRVFDERMPIISQNSQDTAGSVVAKPGCRTGGMQAQAYGGRLSCCNDIVKAGDNAGLGEAQSGKLPGRSLSIIVQNLQ